MTAPRDNRDKLFGSRETPSLEFKGNRLKAEIASLSNNQNKLEPPGLLFPHAKEIEGKCVIKVQVPASSQVHRTGGIVYLRSEDGDYRITELNRIAGFAIDHVIPFALWHNNDIWNLLPAAPAVNTQKSDGSGTGQVAVKRYRADPTEWVFTSDNIAYPTIRMRKSVQPLPILGVMIACMGGDLKRPPQGGYVI